MLLTRLTLKSLLNRRSAVIVTLLSMAVSVALVLGVERLRDGVRDGFSTTVSGTDLIVGPRGTPLSLVLTALFRLGIADHAIDWTDYEHLKADPAIAWVVPLALGDSYRGFPVTATTGDYFRYLKYGRARPIVFTAGRPFQQPHEVVLGAEVARRLSLAIGSELVLTHGIGEAARHEHDELRFTTVGVLAPTGTPIDRGLHIPLAGMERLHAGWIGGMPLPGVQVVSGHDHPGQLNAVLLGLKQRSQVFAVKRRIERQPGSTLSAVIPSLALDQLWQVVAPVERALKVLALLVFAAASLGMAAALLSGLEARRRELAVLRAVGAGPHHLVGLLLAESGVITLAGVLLGALLGFALLALGEGWLLSRVGIALEAGDSLDALRSVVWWLGLLWFGGVLTGMLPALHAYRLSLADGLIVRE